MIPTRHCSGCDTRLPIGEFTKGQTICKRCRKANTEATKKKDVVLPDSYTKQCCRCKKIVEGLEKVRDNFHIDRSRPDHLQTHCSVCDGKSRDFLRQPKLEHHYLSGKSLAFRQSLLRSILTIVKDEERSIPRQLVEDFMHEKEPITFTGREWQIQIMSDMSPNIASRKPSQKGLTWLLERFVIALLMRYNDKPYVYLDHTGKERSRFLEAIYSFETEKKAGSWSKVRLEKVKRDNPHIQDALKMGKSDAALLMQFGRTALYLVGRATVSGVTTISADIVIIDEKDRDQNPDISNQIGSRTLESTFMNTPSTKGLVRTTSTPEVSGAGISLLMESSNYHEWEIFCVECDTWQVSTYPECIGNFYDKGEDPIVDKKGRKLIPYWRCMICKKPIDWKTIGQWDPSDPDHYVNCRWVQRHPERYNPESGEGIVGYQVPFASPDRPAGFFLAERDDPEHDIKYLYNHLLGLPYDDESKTLNIANFQQMIGVQWGYSGRGTYVMGCDHHPAQGGYVTIYKLIDGSIRPTKPEGKWQLVYLEHVRNNKDLWDRMADEDIKKGRIYEIMMEYDINVCVLDLQPDTNEVEKLIEEFAFGRRIWADQSGTYQDSFKMIEEEDKDGLIRPICRIYEDKVSVIDWYFNKIRFGELAYPAEDCKDAIALRRNFIASHTNMYKGEVQRGKGRGAAVKERLAAMNLLEVYKKRQARVHDHWAMSGKFACVAIRVYFQASRSMTGVAPPAIHGMKGRIPGT